MYITRASRRDGTPSEARARSVEVKRAVDVAVGWNERRRGRGRQIGTFEIAGRGEGGRARAGDRQLPRAPLVVVAETLGDFLRNPAPERARVALHPRVGAQGPEEGHERPRGAVLVRHRRDRRHVPRDAAKKKKSPPPPIAGRVRERGATPRATRAARGGGASRAGRSALTREREVTRTSASRGETPPEESAIRRSPARGV